MLAFVPPCNPTSAKTVPAGDAWLHEPKLDGYRLQVIKEWASDGHRPIARARAGTGARSRQESGGRRDEVKRRNRANHTPHARLFVDAQPPGHVSFTYKELTESLRRKSRQLCAMYGRRPRCKRNLTFPRMVGCGHVFGLFLQPLWPLAMM